MSVVKSVKDKENPRLMNEPVQNIHSKIHENEHCKAVQQTFGDTA